MTGRDGNTPWEPPKGENQWEPTGGDGYGWRFPFRDDNGPNDSETAAMPAPGTPRPEPAHTAPSGAGSEYHPPADAGPAYMTPSAAGTRGTTSKLRGMSKSTVAALGVGAAVVAAAAGFGGGWFLQQPKIDEARSDASRLESQLNDSEETRTGSENSLSSLRVAYEKALTPSAGWPICEIDGYGPPEPTLWRRGELVDPWGVGCAFNHEDQRITITSGFLKQNVSDDLSSEGSHRTDDGYRFAIYVDNGVWIAVDGPDDTANKQTAEEVESKLRALKNETSSA